MVVSLHECVCVQHQGSSRNPWLYMVWQKVLVYPETSQHFCLPRSVLQISKQWATALTKLTWDIKISNVKLGKPPAADNNIYLGSWEWLCQGTLQTWKKSTLPDLLKWKIQFRNYNLWRIGVIKLRTFWKRWLIKNLNDTCIKTMAINTLFLSLNCLFLFFHLYFEYIPSWVMEKGLK